MTANRSSMLFVHGAGLNDGVEIRLGRQHTSSEPDSVSLDDVLVDFRLDSLSILAGLRVLCILALVAELL
jgi:hypothetical protein